MSFELLGSCFNRNGGLSMNTHWSDIDVFIKIHSIELQLNGKEITIWTAWWADICWRLSNVFPSVLIICITSIWLLSCSLCIILIALVIDFSTLVMYELHYDVATYELSTYCTSVFVFHIFGMSLTKLLFQMCEGFRFRKIVGCFSADCITCMYSSSVSFSSIKKSLKLIKLSQSVHSINVDKEFDFSMRALSTKLINSMTFVIFIGGIGNFYLQRELFHFLQLLVW